MLFSALEKSKLKGIEVCAFGVFSEGGFCLSIDIMRRGIVILSDLGTIP